MVAGNPPHANETSLDRFGPWMGCPLFAVWPSQPELLLTAQSISLCNAVQANFEGLLHTQELPLRPLSLNGRKVPGPATPADFALGYIKPLARLRNDRAESPRRLSCGGHNPLDFPRTASIGAIAESRPLSSRIPDAASASGLLLVRAAVVAAPMRRTTYDERERCGSQPRTRYRKL